MEHWEAYSTSDEQATVRDRSPEHYDDDLPYTSASSLPKLQFRSDLSKAKWNEELGLAEVIEKKGNTWVSTGIVRSGKTFCFIEEATYLAEIGALRVVDENDTVYTLEDVYGKVAGGKCGCCWEQYEAYRHLKLLGYIVGSHGVCWSVKGANEDRVRKEAELDTLLEEMLRELRVDEIRPVFDVYFPDSKFRKSSPGDPAFILCLVRGNPPFKAQVEELERECGGAPLRFCRVDHGRVSFLSFEKVELPVLP